jgi:hypothetical protein
MHVSGRKSLARDLHARASLANEAKVCEALGEHSHAVPFYDVIHRENQPGSPVQHLGPPL